MSQRVPYFKTVTVKAIKHHLKHLADLKDPSAISSSIGYDPASVVKHICNGALNALKGQVNLSPAQRKALKSHRKTILHLINKRKSIKSKHKLLCQKGGSLLLSILLPILVKNFGSLIFGKNK